MSLLQLLVLQFIAHLLADYIFQFIKGAEDKNSNGFQSGFLKWHFLIILATSWVLSFQLSFIFGALAISITHFLIDGSKKYINNYKNLKKYVFFIDQLLHLIIILSVVILFDKYCGITPLIDISISLKYLLLIAAYILCSKPANIIIKEIFKAFNIEAPSEGQAQNEGDNDLPNAGKLIGNVERFLVLTFIILNQYEAVGFLIAAKSILRYKDGDTIKTEYVLIGTMLSFGIAIASGVIINQLDGWLKVLHLAV
ncbi:MAG: DUF3307 domain-containing protein [Bacteroidota bacterium]